MTRTERTESQADDDDTRRPGSSSRPSNKRKRGNDREQVKSASEVGSLYKVRTSAPGLDAVD